MIAAFGGETVLVNQAPGAVKGKVSGEDMLLVCRLFTRTETPQS